jgi:hypothetical protein
LKFPHKEHSRKRTKRSDGSDEAPWNRRFLLPTLDREVGEVGAGSVEAFERTKSRPAGLRRYLARLLCGVVDPAGVGVGPGNGERAPLRLVRRPPPVRDRAADDTGLDRGGEGGERPGLDRGEQFDLAGAL